MNKIKCAHEQNCCAKHGCQFGDIQCPVYLGYKISKSDCPQCGTSSNFEITEEEFRNRRDIFFSSGF